MALEDIHVSWDLKAKDGRRELKRLAAISWDFESLMPILAGLPVVVTSLEGMGGDQVIRKEDWNVTGRMRILVSLFYKFGVDETLKWFSEWSERNA